MYQIEESEETPTVGSEPTSEDNSELATGCSLAWASVPADFFFPFFLFETKKIVLTEERILISRHPLYCPTCGEMSQRENLPSSAHSALPLLLLILLSADC